MEESVCKPGLYTDSTIRESLVYRIVSGFFPYNFHCHIVYNFLGGLSRQIKKAVIL